MQLLCTAMAPDNLYRANSNEPEVNCAIGLKHNSLQILRHENCNSVDLYNKYDDFSMPTESFHVWPFSVLVYVEHEVRSD